MAGPKSHEKENQHPHEEHGYADQHPHQDALKSPARRRSLGIAESNHKVTPRLKMADIHPRWRRAAPSAIPE